jgi:hypothetical protein
VQIQVGTYTVYLCACNVGAQNVCVHIVCVHMCVHITHVCVVHVCIMHVRVMHVVKMLLCHNEYGSCVYAWSTIRELR